MKQMKNLLFAVLLALGCQNEDIHPVHDEQASKEIYATADQGEVLDLLLDNSGMAAKNGQRPYVDYDMDGFALEEITETEAKLMVIPASTRNKGQQSRILALRVRDTLRTVVFNMYPSTEGGQDGLFNGEITLATIQGELLGGYKVEEGRLAMYYALKGSAYGDALQSKASDDECRLWCGHHWSDPTCICNTQHLEGVTVTAPNNQSITYMPLNGLHMGGGSPYGDGGMGGNYWTYGGAGGGRSNPSSSVDNPPPPSCKSFNFKNVTSNWQEASVVNIRFTIFVLEINGGVRVRKAHTIHFSQPVKFGMPRKFYNGTEIPPGLAAEIGAISINHAIDNLTSKYYNLVVNTTSVIRNDFQTMLKREFQERSNGGRVNFNDMGSAANATQYKTYGIIPDNCY